MPRSGSSPLPRRPSPATGRDRPSPSPISSASTASRSTRSRLEQVADALRSHGLVEAAYVKPAGAPPEATMSRVAQLNDMQPDAGDAPPATPDFVEPAGLPRNGPRRRRRDVRLDAPGWQRRTGQDHRLRVGLAVHARGPAAEPGRRRRRHEQRRHQPRHGRARRDQRRPQRHRRHRASAPDAIDQRVVVQRPVVVAGDQGRGRQARGRRHHPARDPPAGPGRAEPAAGPARLHRDRVVAGRLRGDPLCRRARGSSSSRRPGNGAQNLDDAIYDTPQTGFPIELDEPVQPGQPVVGCRGRRCGCAAAGHARPRLRPGPLAARLLELRRPGRRPGLGARGHVDRVRRSAGRLEPGPLVHRPVLRDVERVAGRRRRARRHAGRAAVPRPPHPDLRGRTTAPAVVRVAAADAPGRPASQRIGKRPEPPRAHSERGEVQVAQRRLRRRRPRRVPDDEPVGHGHPRAGRHDDGRADHGIPTAPASAAGSSTPRTTTSVRPRTTTAMAVPRR